MKSIERVPGTKFTIDFAVGTRNEEDVEWAVDKISTIVADGMCDLFLGLYDNNYELREERTNIELIYNNDEENDDFSFIGMEEV